MSTHHPTQVAIALLRRGDRFLIRRRPDRPGSPMPGLWEFPGGKSEPGETPEQTAARECAEETGMEVQIGRLRRVTRYTYPHGDVELRYFEAQPAGPDSEPAPGSGFIWVEAALLPTLAFPPANEPLLEQLLAEVVPDRTLRPDSPQS